MGSLWMVGFRVGIGYLVAVGTSLVVDYQYRKYGNALLTPLAAPSKLPEVDDEEAIRVCAEEPAQDEVSGVSGGSGEDGGEEEFAPGGANGASGAEEPEERPDK